MKEHSSNKGHASVHCLTILLKIVRILFLRLEVNKGNESSRTNDAFKYTYVKFRERYYSRTLRSNWCGHKGASSV